MAMAIGHVRDYATRFVYLVDGEPCVGDVGDYARAVESAHYNGMAVDSTVWTFPNGQPEATAVKTSSSGYDEDDYSCLTIEVEFRLGDPEVASLRIDGRA